MSEVINATMCGNPPLNGKTHYHPHFGHGDNTVIRCDCLLPPKDALTPFQGWLVRIDIHLTGCGDELGEKNAREQRLTITAFLVNGEPYTLSDGSKLMWNWADERIAMTAYSGPAALNQWVQGVGHDMKLKFYLKHIEDLIKGDQEGEP